MSQEIIKNEFNCPEWINFLNEKTNGDPIAIQQLQEVAGSCLEPETCWRKALILSGEGMGKTTFIKILREMVGPENTSRVPIDGLENQFIRADLKDKWLNFDHLEWEYELENPSFFEVVTGNSIQASRKREDPFFFHPCCQLIFETNRRIEMSWRSGCVQRRCICVPFDYQPANPTINFFNTLLKEIEGIRLWAKEGRDNLNSQGGFTTRISPHHEPPEVGDRETIITEKILIERIWKYATRARNHLDRFPSKSIHFTDKDNIALSEALSELFARYLRPKAFHIG